jgi:hypothetical protein
VYLFKNVHAALTFCFNFSSSQFTKSQFLEYLKIDKRLGNTVGLQGFDGAAQAGFVMGEVDTLLDDFEKAVLACRHIERFDYKNRLNKEFGVKFKIIMNQVVDHIDLDFALKVFLVGMYFGFKQPMNDLAQQFGVCERTMYRYYDRIAEPLAELEGRAMTLVSDRFDKIGLTEREEIYEMAV